MKTLVAVLLTAVIALMGETVGISQIPTNPAGNSVLSVTNALAQAGRGVVPLPVLLLKDSFESVLRKQGKSIADWANACKTGMPACKEDLYGVEPIFVEAAMSDPNARATFAAVPAGSYYVFGQAVLNNNFLVWDVRVDLKPGSNAVTLDQLNVASGNAAPAGTPANAANSQRQLTVDPSIAKARAANVDTRVFGIPLGEPLQIPVCNPLQLGATLNVADGGFTPPTTCLSEDMSMINDFVSVFLPIKIDGTASGLKSIMLARDSCPLWMAKCEAYASFHEGLLVGVAIVTRGREVEAAVAQELRGKYGEPTLVKAATIDPDVGNPFPVNDLAWTRPGLHVQYDVVYRVEGGNRVRTNEGLVRVETELGSQVRTAKEQEQTKPRL